MSATPLKSNGDPPQVTGPVTRSYCVFNAVTRSNDVTRKTFPIRDIPTKDTHREISPYGDPKLYRYLVTIISILLIYIRKGVTNPGNVNISHRYRRYRNVLSCSPNANTIQAARYRAFAFRSIFPPRMARSVGRCGSSKAQAVIHAVCEYAFTHNHLVEAIFFGPIADVVNCWDWLAAVKRHE